MIYNYFLFLFIVHYIEKAAILHSLLLRKASLVFFSKKGVDRFFFSAYTATISKGAVVYATAPFLFFNVHTAATIP